MKHFKQFLLTVLVVLTSNATLSAHDFEAVNSNGVTIYYKILSDTTCAVTYKGDGSSGNYKDYSGEIIIPEEEEGRTVVEIGDKAFKNCNITYVRLPFNLEKIGESSFEQCTKLERINQMYIYVQAGNIAKIIPPKLESIGDYAFRGCSSLTSLDLSTVTTIGASSFQNCNKLSNVVFYKKNRFKLTHVGNSAFRGCKSLSKLDLPETLVGIGDYAFATGSYLVDTVTIGKNVAYIGEFAFSGCNLSCLKYDRADGSHASKAFYGSKVYQIILGDDIRGIDPETFAGMNVDYPQISVRCAESTQSKATIVRESKVLRSEFKTLSANATWGTYEDGNFYELPQAEFKDGYDWAEVTDTIRKEGLAPKTYYACNFKRGFLYNGTFCKVDESACYFWTKGIELTTSYTSTQTTITYNGGQEVGDANIDEVFWFRRNGNFYNEDEFENGTKYSGQDVTINNLQPGKSYTMTYYVVCNGKRFKQNVYGETKSLSPVLTAYNITPTTINVRGEYTHGDAVVTGTVITESTSQTETNSSVLKMKNLLPETEYKFTYTINGEKFSDKVYTYVTTTLPILEAQPAKAMTTTVALLAAKTNLVDDVENVGFEWRRYDAPETMPSTRVEAIVIDGILTGALENVNPDIYYNFRPYFSCKNGKEYFGDWVTFLTGDANVYFDPTVRTYAAEIIDDFSVRLSGSVVRGSSEIVRQGFQYWPNTKTRATDVTTEVEVEGKRMSCVISGLQPETSYSYRTFVQTDKGMSYGQTEEFTTSNTTGIEPVREDNSNIQLRGSLNTQLEILVRNGQGVCHWQLNSLNGGLVGNGTFQADGHYQVIIIPNTQSGLYILNVTNNNMKKSFKLFK